MRVPAIRLSLPLALHLGIKKPRYSSTIAVISMTYPNVSMLILYNKAETVEMTGLRGAAFA